MARLPRLVCPGLPHLLVQGGRMGVPVFSDAADASVFVDALLLAAREAGVGIHGYSLTEQGVRMLCTPDSEGALARMMQAVGRRYVRHFNARHSQQGSPWRGRFRSAVLEEGPQWLSALRISEGVEDADLTDRAEGDGCIRSSLAHHLGQRTDPLISEHRLFWALGNTPFEREAAYRRLLAEPVPASSSKAILEAVEHGWAIGSAAFAAHIGQLTGRRPQPLKRGRPRASSRPKAG